MRKLILAAALTAMAVTLGACDTATVRQDEAKVATIIAAIRQGVAVALSDIVGGIDTACGHLADVNADAQTVSALVTQTVGTPGPKTAAAIAKANTALAAAAAICAGDNTVKSTATANLITLWSDYLKAKSAVTAAQQAAGA